MFPIVVSVCLAVPQKAVETYFPKGVFASKNLELSELVAEISEERLQLLEEPSLWNLSKKEPQTEAYRFFWWAFREEPISFRLTRSGDAFTLIVKQKAPEAGANGKEILSVRTIALTAKQWNEAVSLLNKTSFWKAPTSVIETRGIADGDAILIDGTKNGHFHVIDRTGCKTGESYKSFCRYVIELSGSPMIKVWDKRRKSDRSDPEYKQEYFETDDTGEEIPDKDELK
jgi:hypothetical protein